MENVAMLKQALPYIRRYKHKTFVIKFGGNVAEDTERLNSLAADISLLHQVGIKVVVVHGGGPQANKLSEQLGIKPKIVQGRRVTDSKALEVVKMVFAGKINVEILSAIRMHGVRAVGVSGIDGDIVHAKKREMKKIADPDPLNWRYMEIDPDKVEIAKSDVTEIILKPKDKK